MILGIGVDLCPVERIEKIIERHGEAFLDKVFTITEQRYANQGKTKGERFAARFAAKEATIKALGSPEGLKWKEMEVQKRANGAPVLALLGVAEKEAKRRGVKNTVLSLSHAGKMAVAVVILEGGE